MIGKNDKTAKFILLEDGDVMLKGDQYYNNFKDQWIEISDGEKDEDGNFPDAVIGYDFNSDESKPVRRKNPNYVEPLYKILHNIDGEKVTELYSDAEFTHFMRNIAVENGDEEMSILFINEAKEYLSNYCPNLTLL